MNLTAFHQINTFCIEKNVKLIAVSKTKPAEDILTLYRAGQKAFGENKVQELADKYTLLPKDIEWHFIGHLQTNKVKYIAPFVQLIHTVDSIHLLAEINKRALQNNRIIDCLVQFYIANEETKFGLTEEEIPTFFTQIATYENIRLVGVMGMASFTSDTAQIAAEFETLKKYFEKIKETYFKELSYFKEISMGMSADYALAIQKGSTMVRIGSTIFGSR